MEGLAALVGISILAWIAVAIGLGLALPVAYIWMVVDAILRDQADFRTSDSTEKLIWIVLMLVFQPVAALYFAMVWLPKYREQKAEATGTPVAGPTATVAA